METFTVKVSRVYAYDGEVQVEANSIEEARILAFTKIGDADLKMSEYLIEQDAVDGLTFNEAVGASNKPLNLNPTVFDSALRNTARSLGELFVDGIYAQTEDMDTTPIDVDIKIIEEDLSDDVQNTYLSENIGLQKFNDFCDFLKTSRENGINFITLMPSK